MDKISTTEIANKLSKLQLENPAVHPALVTPLTKISMEENQGNDIDESFICLFSV